MAASPMMPYRGPSVKHLDPEADVLNDLGDLEQATQDDISAAGNGAWAWFRRWNKQQQEGEPAQGAPKRFPSGKFTDPEVDVLCDLTELEEEAAQASEEAANDGTTRLVVAADGPQVSPLTASAAKEAPATTAQRMPKKKMPPGQAWRQQDRTYASAESVSVKNNRESSADALTSSTEAGAEGIEDDAAGSGAAVRQYFRRLSKRMAEDADELNGLFPGQP